MSKSVLKARPTKWCLSVSCNPVGHSVPFSLTPALSRCEREPRRQRLGETPRSGSRNGVERPPSPLEGEGRGEGENVSGRMGCEFTVPPLPCNKLSCAQRNLRDQTPRTLPTFTRHHRKSTRHRAVLTEHRRKLPGNRRSAPGTFWPPPSIVRCFSGSPASAPGSATRSPGIFRQIPGISRSSRVFPRCRPVLPCFESVQQTKGRPWAAPSSSLNAPPHVFSLPRRREEGGRRPDALVVAGFSLRFRQAHPSAG